MLLSQGSQPQPLPKLCLCTPTLTHWLIFLALILNSPHHCGLLWWCGSALVAVTLPVWVLCHCSLASEATASARPIIISYIIISFSCHLPLSWWPSCSCCSLTRCTQSMLITLGFSEDTDREHISVHEFQECLGRKPKSKSTFWSSQGAGHLKDEKKRTKLNLDYPVTQSAS